ncbi:MAG: hypothetical protein JXM70_14900, partial [Pirellulales bacterium]|nr:hypothetical protein [Pirellulales bacterium]
IAYRVAKEPHLGELGPRDLLIVANQTCLSDRECQAIRAAVKRGCRLIVTELSGECDENFRQRASLPLADLHKKPGVRYLSKCPARTSQPSWMRASMPSRAVAIVNTVRKLAKQPFAAELQVADEKKPLTFVDVYENPRGIVAHVVYYGEGQPKNLRLRVAPWLTSGKPVLFSPYVKKPLKLSISTDGWTGLPESFGRYAAVLFKKKTS